jgi:hypothetical protein
MIRLKDILSFPKDLHDRNESLHTVNIKISDVIKEKGSVLINLKTDKFNPNIYFTVGSIGHGYNYLLYRWREPRELNGACNAQCRNNQSAL